jgi:hypothetical protein
LFTYNWDFFGRPLPDGTAAPATEADLWGLWRTWKGRTKREAGVARSTHTMERSLASALRGRVHFHWKVDLRDAVDLRSTASFAFHGVRPDVRPPALAALGPRACARGRGHAFAVASNRAHFYCWVPKVGTVFAGTNWKPFDQYRVHGRWLEELWADGKLAHSTYAELSVRARVGHAARMRDLEHVVADEREARVDARIAEVDAALAGLRAPFREFPAVRAWEDTFLNLGFRWKILVLCADSASGKSTYAECLFDKPHVLTVEAGGGQIRAASRSGPDAAGGVFGARGPPRRPCPDRLGRRAPSRCIPSRRGAARDLRAPRTQSTWT